MLENPSTKTRFQSSRFKKRLTIARNYKRNQKNKAENIQKYFQSKIGLGINAIQIVLGFFVFVVLVFFYGKFGFWNITKIRINGTMLLNHQKFLFLVDEYMHSKPLLPQTNYFLLNKNSLKIFLLEKSSEIKEVSNIQKKFPGTIEITLNLWQEEFLLKTTEYNYVLSSDGTVIKKFKKITEFSEAEANQISNLKEIFFDGVLNVGIKNQIVTAENIFDIKQIQNYNSQNLTNKDVKIELLNLKQGDLKLTILNKFIVYYNLKNNVNQSLKDHRLLFENLGGSLNNLEYADFRVAQKAYVCYKNTACSKTFGASSTLPSIINN